MSQLATLLAQANGNEVDTPQLLIGIVSIVLGILILIVPRLLNYIVAAYLIYVGLVNVFDVKF